MGAKARVFFGVGACALVLAAWRCAPDSAPGRQALSVEAVGDPAHPVGYFLRPFAQETPKTVEAASALPAWLANLTHYRLLPAIFPGKMGYHFDGLATVLKFDVSADAKSVTFVSKPYMSDAAKDFGKCIFYGTGYGPTVGTHICFTNPGVNLLPMNDQLWLTIDTPKWGRVDPKTLETIDAVVNTTALTLNAHPACDPKTGQCFVQHPCPGANPRSNKVCFSELHTGSANSADMQAEELGRITLPSALILQHSHSPCITEHYLVSKLDSFEPRNPLNSNSGLLKLMRQHEDSQWLVYERATKKVRLMKSPQSFVNNHFWNCYEDGGSVVVEAVSATHDYLDTYFEKSLEKVPVWDDIFHPPMKCHVPFDGETVDCAPLMNETLYFDYPTFNTHYKTKDYQYFYGIAAADPTKSRWFDQAIKVDRKAGKVVATWDSPGVYLTEFDFVPKSATAAEDDGALVAVLYNATADTSLFGVFDAKTLTPQALFPLGTTIPFHAHGIICQSGKCYPNP